MMTHPARHITQPRIMQKSSSRDPAFHPEQQRVFIPPPPNLYLTTLNTH